MLDSSAVLAYIFEERGGDMVEPWLQNGCISAVNHSEVVGKFFDEGLSAVEVDSLVSRMSLDVREFDEVQALHTGRLRLATRACGLSLGDRACLALAGSLGLPAITADKAWASLDIGIKIELIR